MSNGGMPMVKSNGLILTDSGLSVVCPKCSGEAPLNETLLGAISNRMVLFFRGKALQRADS